MAFAAYPDQPRRRLRMEPDDEIEEGEIVDYYSDIDTGDEDARYFVRRPRSPEPKRRRLAGSRCSTPSSGSDATTSAGLASSAAPVYSCPVCPREFNTRKGVHGHMRVHALAPMDTVAAQVSPSNQLALALAPQQIVAHHPPAAHAVGFRCKEAGCGMWFPTHQGLGGHVAGHKNKRKEAVAGDSGAADRPAKVHACKVCGQVFPTGVALGGHMRKHYNGNKQPARKQGTSLQGLSPEELALALAHRQAGQELPLAPAPMQAEPDLELALGPGVEAARPASAPALFEARPGPSAEVAQPAQAPAVPRAVRLFGVIIGYAPRYDPSEDSNETV